MKPRDSRRMARIERSLRQIAERQSLARLDTAMFLAYPLLILGMTTLVSQVSQLSVARFESVTVYHSLEIILVSFFFLYGSWGFIGYVQSYLGDDIIGRVHSFRKFVWGSYGMLFQVGLYVIGPKLISTVSTYPRNLLGVLTLVVMYWNFAIIDVWNGVVSESTFRVIKWIDKNAPARFKSIEYIRFTHIAVNLTRIKLSLVLASLCGAGFLVYVWWQGVRGLLFFGALLAGFVVLTIVVLWSSQLRTGLKKIFGDERRRATLRKTRGPSEIF